ncbi:caspase family protein [Labedaea rhizosphaerae]|uniref:Caspase domain-containing protein n=1 Tax=Labedaea rhizosphaerae TaxID=598644 RepID=A0A4R6RU73_LABRH|nr:caspase family protein [Labedaea rhizosphaerae]TDP89897.1 caspase domain-containing protein [Labedaea rhizosphaerae]
MRLAKPETSKAILIGAAQYDDPALADITQARANVEDLAAILVDPALGEFRPEHVRTMINPRHKEDASLEIDQWCRTAEDTLVVYYAGHGLVDDNGELLLATSDTIEAAKHHRSLRAELLRRAVKVSHARIRILILDCCYSGRAFGQVMADEASAVLDQTETTGTCGLASAPRHLTSLFVAGERHTVFSGELIRVLRDGLPGEGAALSVFAVYQQLRRRMRDRGHPEPKIVHSDSVSEFALVRNRAHDASVVPPATATPPVTSPPPPIVPPSPVRAARPRLKSIAEADEFANRIPHATELAIAASGMDWPLLARLRFIADLARTGEKNFAQWALQDLRAIDAPGAVTAINRLLKELGNGRAWDDEAWRTADLVQGSWEPTDVKARQVWGVAMAMLLAAAAWPTPLRVQAIEELAELGHRDEAVWIAQGVLRDRRADPALVDAVRAFLARAGAGTPGPIGAVRPAPPRSADGRPRT